MFFTKLYPLLESLNLSFDLKQKNDKVRLVIKFNIQNEKSELINLTPLVIEALPEDLDKELVDELIYHLKLSVPSLSSQISVLTSNLKKFLEDTIKAASPKKGNVKTKIVEPQSNSLDFNAKVEEKEEEVKKVEPEKVKTVRKRRTKAEIEADKKAGEEDKIVDKAELQKENEEELVDKAELEKEDDADNLFSDEIEEEDNLFSNEIEEDDPFA